MGGYFIWEMATQEGFMHMTMTSPRVPPGRACRCVHLSRALDLYLGSCFSFLVSLTFSQDQ
jgi:hypothetical protein